MLWFSLTEGYIIVLIMETLQKKVKKSKTNYSVYIPPPARKAATIKESSEKLKSEGKKKCSKKKLLPKSEESDPHYIGALINEVKKNDSHLAELGKESDSKHSDLSNLLINTCVLNVNSGESRDGQCSGHRLNVASDDGISESDSAKTSAVILNDENLCFRDYLCNNLNQRLKDVDDNHNKGQETDRNLLKSLHNKNKSSNVNERKSDLSASGPISNIHGCDSENGIFQNVWEKLLLEYKTLETNPLTTVSRTRSIKKTHKRGKEIYWEQDINENCIIEIYGFPQEYKTHDLLAIFSEYLCRGFMIRWVDDTHALGIFSTQVTAYQVLITDLPSVKTRPLREATPLSKEKAKKLMPPPPPPRPKTCSASVRRLVSGALGIKPVFTQAEIEAEKEMLKVAREQRTLAKQKEAT